MRFAGTSYYVVVQGSASQSLSIGQSAAVIRRSSSTGGAGGNAVFTLSFGSIVTTSVTIVDALCEAAA